MLQLLPAFFLVVLSLAGPVHAADVTTADDLYEAFWSAVDKGSARDMRKLVHKDSHSQNLRAYLDQYLAVMQAVRTRYPDHSQYGFSLLESSQVPNYDVDIPAALKSGQLDVYPTPADVFLQLHLAIESGLAEIDLLPVSQQDGQWWLVVPEESIAWPGLEARFSERQAQKSRGEPTQVIMPTHVELPAFPPSMMSASTSGCARVSFTVDVEGEPGNLSAAHSEPSGLPGREARDSMRKWRFVKGSTPIQGEQGFVFLAESLELAGVENLAKKCGVELADSFLITPTASGDPNRMLQMPQGSPDARY